MSDKERCCENCNARFVPKVTPVYSSDTERRFIRFLCDNGVYTEFMNRLSYTPRDYRGMTLCAEVGWNEYKHKEDPYVWITFSFAYDITPTDFCELSLEWKRILNEIL